MYELLSICYFSSQSSPGFQPFFLELGQTSTMAPSLGVEEKLIFKKRTKKTDRQFIKTKMVVSARNMDRHRAEIFTEFLLTLLTSAHINMQVDYSQ